MPRRQSKFKKWLSKWKFELSAGLLSILGLTIVQGTHIGIILKGALESVLPHAIINIVAGGLLSVSISILFVMLIRLKLNKR